MKSFSKTILASIVLLISSSAFAQNKVDTTMIVNGVCDMCKFTIESSAQIKGVQSVSWDVESKVLTVNYNTKKTSLEKIGAAINAAGYDTEYSTANEEAYNNLHGCCKYRDPEVVKSHQTPKSN